MILMRCNVYQSLGLAIYLVYRLGIDAKIRINLGLKCLFSTLTSLLVEHYYIVHDTLTLTWLLFLGELKLSLLQD